VERYRELLQRIKAATDIVRIIEAKGIKLERSGKNFLGLCPFHGEKKPSFVVYPETQSFYCFGCGKGGDAIHFIQLLTGESFLETIERLAAEYGLGGIHFSEEDKVAIDKRKKAEDVLAKTAQFYRRNLPQDVSDHLTQTRGYTPETIEAFQIGYAAGGLKRHLVEECGFPEELGVDAGVLWRGKDESSRDFFYKRIVFPVIKAGRIVSMTGRSFPTADPKWLHLPGEIEHLYNEDALRNPEEYLAEGAPDCITASQNGLPSVGILGKNLKSSWVERFSRCEKVYLGIHLHENAGPEKALEIAGMLGDKARIVVVPEEGKDLTEYMQGKDPGVFQDLLKAALDSVQFQLRRIPSGLETVELGRVIKPILEAIAGKDEVAIETYLAYIYDEFKSVWGITKDDIKSYRGYIRDCQAKQRQGDGDGQAGIEIVWEDPYLLNPAQDFVNGKAYYTVYLPIRVAGVNDRLPYVVTSDREFFPLTKQDLQKHGLRLRRPTVIPSDLGRWSIEENVPNSIHQYLHGTPSVDPLALFSKIHDTIKTYLDYPDSRYYIFLTLFCIGTYFFMAFDSFPYVFLHATRRAGKTRSMEIIAPICFNSLIAASISDAAMYRSIENDRCTIFHDEAAKYKGKTQYDLSERLEIFNSGYKKSGSVRRCDGDDAHAPQDYSTYSPKVLANIEGLDDTAADRTVTMRLLRCGRRLPKFKIRALAPVFQEIRNCLYVFALDNHAEIESIYDELSDIPGLQDREEEIWGPIVTLAEFLDRRALKAADAQAKVSLLTDKMIEMAHSCRERKQEEEEEASNDQKILMAVVDFISDPEVYPREAEDGGTSEFYSSDDLGQWIMTREGWEKMSKNYLGRILTKFQILRNKHEDKLYIRGERGKQILYYRLNRERIEDVARRYGLQPQVAAMDGLASEAEGDGEENQYETENPGNGENLAQGNLAGDLEKKNGQQNGQQNRQQMQLLEVQDELPF
jgi:DNA primase